MINLETRIFATEIITDLFNACGYQSPQSIRHELIDQVPGIEEDNIDDYYLTALEQVIDLSVDEDGYYSNGTV
jgi:hypothetical protein